MSENIRDSFQEMKVLLEKLEKKYNSKGKNLHFEAIPEVDEKLFADLLLLSDKAIEIIKDVHDRYSNSTAYAHIMFDFWYEYFLIISSASVRVKNMANPDDVSKETIWGIIKDLIVISEFSAIVSGDLYARNYEALGNTILSFYSDNLKERLNNQRETIQPEEVRGFLDTTIERVEKILHKK